MKITILTSSDGLRIGTFPLENNCLQLPEELSSGLYFLNAVDANGTLYRAKFVKE